jgi:acyl dehydratase
MLAAYLRGVREADATYATEGNIHPGMVLRFCNRALMENVVLGPWIHMGSTVRNFAIAHAGDTLSVRAQVTANREQKGHRFVDLDALVVANAITPIARVAHTAIYRLRGTSA